MKKMFSSFLVIHRTSIVRQLFDTFFDYFRISERQDFEQSLIRNRTGNNNSSNFFWQLVQNKVFKNTNKLIVGSGGRGGGRFVIVCLVVAIITADYFEFSDGLHHFGVSGADGGNRFLG